MKIKGSKLLSLNLKSTERIIIHSGGTSCFGANQLICTDKGSVPISSIKKGSSVKTFSESTNKDEWKPVKDVMKFANTKPAIKIKLKNGESITCTEDHKFYFKGEWVCIKDILSLWDEDNSKL